MRNSSPIRETIAEKIGQLFFIGIPATNVDPATSKLLMDIQPGGVCLFSRNIQDSLQTRNLTEDIRHHLKIPPFISLDQEGGLVDRLRRLLSPMPAASKLSSAEDAVSAANIIAEAIRILGFNMDFAPVVDVIGPERSAFSNGLYSRTFGSSADEVVILAGAFLKGLQGNGCLGCLKHFPGLGASELDSHDDLPLVPISQTEWHDTDLLPYRDLLKSEEVSAVMVGHSAYPEHHLQEIDQNGKLLPSSLSRKFVTNILRTELNYEGMILTDDLEMGAIIKNYGIGEASVLAILAGEDMVSICAGIHSIYESHSAISAAVEEGRITESRIDESLERILSAKEKLHDPLPFDAGRLASLTIDIQKLNERLN